jgi:hypothetical protein
MDSEELYEALVTLEYDLDRYDSKKQFDEAVRNDVYLDMALDKIITVATSIDYFIKLQDNEH